MIVYISHRAYDANRFLRACLDTEAATDTQVRIDLVKRARFSGYAVLYRTYFRTFMLSGAFLAVDEHIGTFFRKIDI